MGYDKHYRKDVFYKGSATYGLKVYSQTLTPVGVSTITVEEQEFTISGLATTDRVIGIDCSGGVGTPLGIVGARVSATDTLAVKFVNPTVATATPSAGTYRVIVIKI